MKMSTTDLRYTVERLDVSERPPRRYRYWVSGTGPFPFDMLRYDRACPVSPFDAEKLAWNYTEGRVEYNRRSIELMSYQEPTVDRWSSFTWSVGDRKIY